MLDGGSCGLVDKVLGWGGVANSRTASSRPTLGMFVSKLRKFCLLHFACVRRVIGLCNKPLAILSSVFSRSTISHTEGKRIGCHGLTSSLLGQEKGATKLTKPKKHHMITINQCEVVSGV